MRTIGACLVIIGLCVMLLGGMMEGWPIGHILAVELVGLAVLSAGAAVHNKNRRPCSNTDDIHENRQCNEMLTTCDKCRRRDYCDNCADKDSCYWMRVIPPEGGRRLSCESFRCAHYKACKKLKPDQRPTK